MMLPILISVSVAPTSYFFCASAALLLAERITRAADTAASRNWSAGILISLDRGDVSIFVGTFVAPLWPFNTLAGTPSTESPLRRGHRGRIFSRGLGRGC